jgi:hypothetical protein
VTAWLIAVAVGVGVALVQYVRGAPTMALRIGLGALRALAIAGVVALALDAPLRPPRPVQPAVFVDASRSMTRGDSAVWRAAWDSVGALSPDTVWAFGDSVYPTRRGGRPIANGSHSRPVVERAMATGRPAIVITDGELQDSSALDALVSGSRVIVLPRAAQRDVAVVSLDAPRAAVQGDSLALRVTLGAAALGAAAGTLTATLDDRPVGRWPFDSISSWGERQLEIRVHAAGDQGAAVLKVVVNSAGDVEPRNDTLGVAVELSRAASAVFVSTSPDQDARFAIAVLRGALALPTRGYYRVAPGRWRHEGTLASVTEVEVRQAVKDAPVAIFHGDTGIFGPPQQATAGPMALIAPPDVDDGEWYVIGTPPSPLSPALAALPLDSLAPIASGVPAVGDWIALEARRGREDVRRAVVSGRDSPRRVAVITGAGFWRWRFRGGASADAYAALWGGIFDWLAAERADKRGAVPDERLVRAGDVIRWRRGSSADSVVHAVVSRRGARRADTLTLRFAPGVSSLETPGLDAGIYDVAVPNGRAILAVNQPGEMLPARPRLESGSVGRRSAVDASGGARSAGWFYALVIALLCLEWFGRRRAGLR